MASEAETGVLGLPSGFYGRADAGRAGLGGSGHLVPDPEITPGAVRTTDVGEICSAGTKQLRHWDRARDDRVMAEYGLPAGPHPQYEIDHLVSLCLGGADSDSNLWPQPRRSLEPIWNAERKDVLEARLCALACSGQLDVAEAQHMIAEDWTESYRAYFGKPKGADSRLAKTGADNCAQ